MSKDEREKELTDALEFTQRQLSPDIKLKLQHARMNALESRPRSWVNRNYAAAAFGVMALGLGVLFLPKTGELPGFEPEMMNLELVAEDPQLLQDLDFALWLAENSELLDSTS